MSRLRRVFHLREWGPEMSAGVAWELEHHLAERTEELIAAGYSPAAAREEAVRAFGDVARVRRDLERMDGRVERRRAMVRVLDDLMQDIRYGLRGIRLNPGIAVGVVLTLALGIGANASMFSVVDALMLRPLPYDEPQELMDMTVVTPSSGGWRVLIPYAVARGWQERNEGAVMVHARRSALYTGGVEPRTIPVQAVTPEFHNVLGVTPAIGRGLVTQDADPGSPEVIVLDHGFWSTDLGADPGVLGNDIVLNGRAFTVIGVMPRGFRFPTYSTTSGWVALRTDGSTLGRAAGESYVEAVMRVAGGAGEAAIARAAGIGRTLFQARDPDSESVLGMRPLGERRGGDDIRRAMVLLSGAVGLILLVAGVNMANLLLARGSMRGEEMAVRIAVGAARERIVRQIATEAMLLALLGGAAAVVVSLLVMRAMQSIMPESITFFAPHAIAIERRTMLFTFGTSVISGLLFGLLPALGALDWARPAGSAGLTRYASRTPSRRRLRRGLVVIEVAFSVMLLITASLLINSFVRLMRVDPGMRLDNLAVLQFGASPTTYPTDEERGVYLRRLTERIAALPGVEAATLTGGLPPYTSFYFGLSFEPEGGEPRPLDESSLLPHTTVGADFFDVTGARLVAGRPFLAGEDRSSGSVIIDQDLARHLWPDGSAVGRRFRFDPDRDGWMTVVGVTADLRLMGPDERQADFALMHPAGNHEHDGQVAMAVRTRGDPRAALASIRFAVREVDPNQPIQELVPATTYWAAAVEMPRFLAVMIGILAALALALAAIGVHGVLAFGVAQRRQELGMRLVLGAGPAELRRLVVGEGLVLAGIGIVLGVAGALLSTRIVRSALYGIDAVDPATFAGVMAGVLVVAAAATLRPARRAARLDPLEVIR